MARPVSNMLDLIAIRLTVVPWTLMVENIANCSDDIEVRFLAETANQIRFARSTIRKNAQERITMIVYV